MKRLMLAVAAVLFSASAYAQPPAPPECKDLPNGGRLEINIPGATFAPACASCVAGFPIPPNWVLGYSNGHHDTCELKKPTGENSGDCRKDTTCPPGTTRTYQNNTLWVCQYAGTKRTIDCPVPPRLPDPVKIVTEAAPPGVKACVERLKSAAEQMTTAGKNFVDAAATSTPGATPKSIGGAGVQAGVMFGLSMTHLATAVIPATMRKKATCDNVDKTNPTAMSDCNAARADLSTTRERQSGFVYKFKGARDIAKREVGELVAGNAGLRTAGDRVTGAVDAGASALDSCVAEVLKVTP
jgi:hypothetical protein